jgi:hypothetical protein
VTINEQLAALGYTTLPHSHGRKQVLRDGAVVITGTAGDVWAWLRTTGQVS